MAETRIAGKALEYDSNNRRVYDFVNNELEATSHREAFEAYCEKAYRDRDKSVIITDKYGHKYKLISESSIVFKLEAEE